MAERLDVDICIIGAGTGGLTVAAGAAQLGARTVLFERNKMGGDCLNYGCVPSKSLLAAAKVAKTVHAGSRFGIKTAPPVIDFSAVNHHIHDVIAAIAPNDSEERFEALGVKVIRAEARFHGPGTVAGGGFLVGARRIVIASGSSPAAPPITGLDHVPFFTNETLFDNTELPEHLIIIGGGPFGLEMAQAHRLLGSRVTVLEAAHVLARDDPELVAILRERLSADGVAIREEVKVKRIERTPGGIVAVLERRDTEERIEGSHLLVATGRRPNVQELDLEKAGIAHGPGGIMVDRRLRTTNPRVYAIGDVTGGAQFTHIADYHARIVIRNALFRLPAKVDYRPLPWATFTDPELAQVGMTEAEARRAHGDALRLLRWPFRDNDRAQTEGETEGLIKVVARRNGRILGASILGAHAGELIQVWGLAIGNGMTLGAVANMIVTYPTLGDVNRRIAGSFYTPILFGTWPRRLARFLAYFG